MNFYLYLRENKSFKASQKTLLKNYNSKSYKMVLTYVMFTIKNYQYLHKIHLHQRQTKTFL